jgi:hypothetical protein
MLNFPIRFRRRSFIHIEIHQRSFFLIQPRARVLGNPLCQPTGGDFFLHQATSMLHRPGLGSGDDTRLERGFQGLLFRRRNFFIHWEASHVMQIFRRGWRQVLGMRGGRGSLSPILASSRGVDRREGQRRVRADAPHDKTVIQWPPFGFSMLSGHG